MGREIKKYKTKTYDEENDELMRSYWSRFLSGEHSGFKKNLKIEILIENKNDSEKTNQKLSFLNNLELFLNWLTKNICYPYQLNIWSEKSFSGKLEFDSLKLIFEKLKKVKNKPTAIFIFCNFSFLFSQIYRNKLEKIIKRAEITGIPFTFLFIDEGKDKSSLKCLKSNNKDCENVFSFIKSYSLKYLGIVSPVTVREWKEKFLLFQRKFSEYNISSSQFHLMEEKEAMWNKRKTKEFVDFISFLINWSFCNLCNGKVNRFLDFLFKEKGYGVLYDPLGEKLENIRCSVKDNLCIRVKDLSIIPCHEIQDKPFILGRFQVGDNKKLKLKSNNLELLIGLSSFDKKNLPMCETCLLKYLCNDVCLFSQFEKTGDLFSPDPALCRFKHWEIMTMVKEYKKLGIYGKIYNKLNKDKKDSLDLLSNLTF